MKKEKQTVDVYLAPPPTHGQSDIEILELAISNYGHWSWIQVKLPEIIALEFWGVQLMTPPTKEGGPLSNTINLVFREPGVVIFLKRKTFDLPDDWIHLWKQDRLQKKFSLAEKGRTGFTLQDDTLINKLLESEEITKINYFKSTKEFEISNNKIKMALFNGEVGIIIAAEEFSIQDLKEEYHLDQVAEKSKRWWDYWEKYHGIKKTNDKFPEDSFCSTILPVKDSELLLEKIKKGENSSS